MRVLYFSRDYSTHDHRFLTALAKTEHKLFFMRLERRDHPLEDRPLPSEIELVNWAGGNKAFTYANLPGYLVSLKRVIKKIEPDLIQAGPIQTSAFLVALAGFQPLLSMSWGYDLLLDAEKDAFWRWATHYTLHHSALMVGDCATIRQRAVSYGMDDNSIVTFPWGIDLAHFKPVDCQLITKNNQRSEASHTLPTEVSQESHIETFTILSTRSWEEVYGVDVLARAFVMAAQQNKGLNLVMLGNGSQAAMLRKIFFDGGVLERVSFPGQVSYANLPRYYRSADLYVCASHSDGTSISLLEAMACGLPVLVSDIPGNREWVKQGIQGWLFPDGNVYALAQGIIYAAQEKDRLPQLSRASRILVEQRADWSKNFPVLLYAYDKVFMKHARS